MNYTTILTSKGTTTIPAEIRHQLGLKPGMVVSFKQDQATGEYVIGRAHTLEELRVMNKKALHGSKKTNRPYRSGDGFGQHIQDKYISDEQ